MTDHLLRPEPEPTPKADAFGFYDATCPGCRRRFGWTGSLENRPPCPGCGFHPDPEAAEKPQGADDAVEARRAACKHQVRARSLDGRVVCTCCGMTWTPDELGELEGPTT